MICGGTGNGVLTFDHVQTIHDLTVGLSGGGISVTRFRKRNRITDGCRIDAHEIRVQ